MPWDEEDGYTSADEAVAPSAQDDPKVQQVEALLLQMFDQDRSAVYYESQLAVIFEKRFFHWITSRALRDMANGALVGSFLEVRPQGTSLRYYFHRSNRYWRRRAAKIRALVEEFSAPAVTQAVGVTAETLIDSGLPRRGFMPQGENVQTWNGKTWDKTNHDLDRVFTRDGIAYGLEIKNKLGYIDQTEFQTKLAMCRHLDLRPLFVARMMPETYMRDVRQAGGFNLLMGRQFYPLGYEDLAQRIERELQIPTGTPRRLEDGTLDRFYNWHKEHGGT